MKPQDLLSLDGLRVDGRKPDEVRSISAQLGVVPGADGSVLVEQGQTRVLVAVYGPYETKKGALSIPSTRALINDALRTAVSEYQAPVVPETHAARPAQAVAGAVFAESDDSSIDSDMETALNIDTVESDHSDSSISNAPGNESPATALKLLPPATAHGRVHCEYSTASFAGAASSVRTLRAYRRRQQNRYAGTAIMRTSTMDSHDEKNGALRIGRTEAAPHEAQTERSFRLPGTVASSKFRQKSREAAEHIREVFEPAILVGSDANSAGSSRYMPSHAQVDIFVQVLQSDGSEFAVAVNAVSLALLHAAVPLRDLIVACSAVALPTEELGSGARRFVAAADPSNWELQQARIWQATFGAVVPEVTVAVLAGESFQPVPQRIVDFRDPHADSSLEHGVQLLWVDYRNMALDDGSTKGLDCRAYSVEQVKQLLDLACGTGCAETYRWIREAALHQTYDQVLRYEWSSARLQLPVREAQNPRSDC